ncbi:hypothetical protein F2Q70_00031453 [Brassica cretica]|uniref:Uncharacterized protein n=1 Tax=Brassica cretica TaxID=69181 RepID=A0A8S9H969_BRACR|nr:hypothetical protein F2Q70_00031453 [Brassica cretica]KAF2552518.1 hypothetical protein F2Q68_00035859 [Brassica cretica]
MIPTTTFVRNAYEKSKKAFWAFCRLSYVQVLHRKKWPEDVQSLQHVTRDLALGDTPKGKRHGEDEAAAIWDNPLQKRIKRLKFLKGSGSNGDTRGMDDLLSLLGD